MLLLYFLSVLIVMAISLLFVPIILFIDTNTNQYYFQCKGLAKVSFEANEEEFLKIKLNLFFMNFNFYPLREHKKHVKRPQLTKAKKKQSRFNLKAGMRVLKTFKVKQFVLDIDTGDCIYNAKLYPVFAFLNYRNGNFKINFVGRNQLMLHLENRPIYILRSFINI